MIKDQIFDQGWSLFGHETVLVPYDCHFLRLYCQRMQEHAAMMILTIDNQFNTVYITSILRLFVFVMRFSTESSQEIYPCYIIVLQQYFRAIDK